MSGRTHHVASHSAANTGHHHTGFVLIRDWSATAKAVSILTCDRWMQRQPMIDTVLERRHFRIETGETTIMFGNAGTLVEESLPVLGRPTIVAGRSSRMIPALWRDKRSRIASKGCSGAAHTRSSPSTSGVQFRRRAPPSGPRLCS